MQAQTPTVVAREAPRGGVRLVFCERGYTSSSIWGYCFLQLPAKDALVPALNWVLSAGQYPLHHSICLPHLTCSLVSNFFWYWFSVMNRRMLYFHDSLWYRFSGRGFWCWFPVRVSWAFDSRGITGGVGGKVGSVREELDNNEGPTNRPDCITSSLVEVVIYYTGKSTVSVTLPWVVNVRCARDGCGCCGPTQRNVDRNYQRRWWATRSFQLRHEFSAQFSERIQHDALTHCSSTRWNYWSVMMSLTEWLTSLDGRVSLQ